MKNLIIIFLAMIIISCTPTKSEFSEIAKTTKLLALDGSSIAFQEILKKHEGKTVLIEVWASWCGDCVKNMPNLKMLQASHQNVDFLFLSADKTADKWKEGIAKHDLKGDQYLITDGMKGIFGASIDLNWIPRYIILDKSGKIITYRAIETDFEKVNETLSKLE
ncbi:MAG: TlpA family protein disulfide reductase [Flavobacterium sp.]|nr:TlpA family protein disulfide reductase [Flavobacterium sp.]